MSKLTRASFVFWLIVTIIPIVGIVLGVTGVVDFYATQEELRDAMAIFGLFTPIAFVLLQAVQVVITPISHYSIGIIGGFLYGPYLGGLLNWVGRIIGHLVAFFLARSLGRKVASRFVSEKTLQKYDGYVSDKSLILFLFYFLPVFPDDEMSYLAGLSKMKFRSFFFANLFGHVGGSLWLAYIGSGINIRDTLFLTLTVVSFVAFLLLWWLVIRKRNIEGLNPKTRGDD